MGAPNLPAGQTPDWDTIPAPADDGGADHLTGAQVASVPLVATSGVVVNLATVPGRTVVYIYPMTGAPGTELPENWDNIPGARGCTPQSCAFRDHYEELKTLGVDYIFGLSTQALEEQEEVVERLQLPYPVLSDRDLALARAMSLPVFEAGGYTRLKRMAWIVEDGVIEKVFYPVFPPDQNAADVVDWLAKR